MARTNRVLPTGEIVAHPARGLFMGNRGRLHDDHGRLVRQQSSQRFWITCTLVYKDRKRTLAAPGSYTELFFLDEAVALAAGHRPCAECRRADYNRFRDAYAAAFGGGRPSAAAMDAALGPARREPDRRQRRHERRLGDLPRGAFVLHDDGPALWTGARLLPFDPAGYGAPVEADPGRAVVVLTPAPTVAVLAAGYRPVLHPSAGPADSAG